MLNYYYSRRIICSNNILNYSNLIIQKFEGITRNFTYTVGVECVSQLGILNNNNGVICKLRKSFLKEKLFRIDLVLLKSTNLK